MRKLIGIAGVATLAIAASVGLATPANAATRDHDGWTLAQFVAAAAQQGVPNEVAVKAYNDPDLIESIPVAATGGAKVDTAVGELATPAAAASTVNRTAQCWYGTKNILGSFLTYLRLTKTWSINTTTNTVAPVSLTYYQEANLGWSFTGIVGSQDYYGTYAGISHGKHTSIRDAHFENSGAVPSGVTNEVTIAGNEDGSWTCGGH